MFDRNLFMKKKVYFVVYTALLLSAIAIEKKNERNERKRNALSMPQNLCNKNRKERKTRKKRNERLCATEQKESI